MKKFLLLVAFFSGLIFISVKYSGRVYTTYLKLYYNKTYTENELLIKSRYMYEQKKYKELEDFINPLLVIYPENNEFKKIAAFNYLKLGDSLRSAELFSDVSGNSIEENHLLEEMMKDLYYNGNFGDLLYFYDRKIMVKNVNTAFYYGVALYKKGRYDESYASLMYSKSNTFMLPELYFYIGLNLDKKGNTKAAIDYVKTAFEADRINQLYKKELIDLYRKSGFYREAEIILRSR